MIVKDIENMNPDIRNKLDVSMAVWLIETLFLKGEISERTFSGVRKEANFIVDTKESVC